MINIIISAKSEKPIYQQLIEQISAQIIKGQIKSDANLPSIRTTAKELSISVITVKKAWEELERQGLIYTVVGKGSFVSNLSKEDLKQKKEELIRSQFKKDIQYYRDLEVSKEELIKLIKNSYNN